MVNMNNSNHNNNLDIHLINQDINNNFPSNLSYGQSNQKINAEDYFNETFKNYH